ncbi:nucleotidyltransferase domain-containing protein [Priestia megaterium]
MDNYYNIGSIPRELKLLLIIMNMESRSLTEDVMKDHFTSIDWDLFLQLARHHRIYPLIYSRLIKVDEKLVPDNIIQVLRSDYQRNTFKMLQLSAEMEQISRLFSIKQIRLLFLKGPAIAADIYGDISLRTSKDLDILIPVTDLANAEKILLNQGYRKEGFVSTSSKLKCIYHHIAYYHPEKGIEIEVHWKLHSSPTKEPNFDELWDRRRTSSLTSYPVYLLGEEDLFLFLLAHGARHGWFRLRWLVDIDHILRKKMHLQNNNLLTKEHPYYFILGQALILTSQLLKTPINIDMQILIKEKRSRKLAELAAAYIREMGYIYTSDSKKGTKKSPGNIGLYKTFRTNCYLFLTMSNSQKFFFAIKLLFPSNSDMETLRLPDYLHFLYFPLRPFLSIWRKYKSFFKYTN